MAVLKTFLRTAGAAIAILSCLLAPAQAATKEYELKAAIILKLMPFVEWPPTEFSAPGDPLVVAVLGQDPFGNYLDEIFKGEEVHDRPVVVRRFRRVEDLGRCHILFIAQSESQRLPDILQRLRGKGVLTVGESRSFIEQGGGMQYVIVQGRVRFRMNLEATRTADLKVSSKFLRLATEVLGDQKP